jgi:signal-transduction protein with cAMP-binding, CBS, and nucleotidyltransferase domain
MRLRDVLAGKSKEVRTIASQATCGEVVNELVRHNIGSLIVRDSTDGPILGIITERDILKVHAANSVPLAELPVAKYMSSKLETASPDDDIMVAMGLMTTHRIRHLPVIENGQLFGLLSIGDVVKAQHDELVMENHHMLAYIQGGGSVATQVQ